MEGNRAVGVSVLSYWTIVFLSVGDYFPFVDDCLPFSRDCFPLLRGLRDMAVSLWFPQDHGR